MLHARTNSINSEHVSINLQRHRSARARTTQPIGNLSMRQPAALRAKTRKGLAVKNVLEELQVLFSSLFFIFFFSFLLFVCLFTGRQIRSRTRTRMGLGRLVLQTIVGVSLADQLHGHSLLPPSCACMLC